MSVPRATAWLVIIFFPLYLGGCSSLLPKGETETEGPWQTFWEAQQTFDKIIPHQTTVEALKQLKLDPESNPNVTILNYSDVLRRFIPSPTINASDLDPGVQECISAKTACKGYEIDQRVMKRNRYGNFWADVFNFERKVDIAGWRFNGVILIKDDLVVYKLTGGQPAIHEREENKNPLGPFQGFGERLLSH
ncbi:MAG: hypothetical protein COW70_07825 [Hydrogenophilales bacterium CG18_big_fil_WC_8_21_14_2_50_58_12]|nr:MAG: hypothetical protein COW70_07825 [Hydrogenophilales bacterium CG18_big_fil_WC_8_21_14_2_50_58_12]